MHPALQKAWQCLTFDFSDNLWPDIWNLAMNFYNSEAPKMPDRLSSDLQELKKKIHNYAMDNSVLAVEVPTLECIDTKSFSQLSTLVIQCTSSEQHTKRLNTMRKMYDEKL